MFRKISTGLWRAPDQPVIYAHVDFDIHDLITARPELLGRSPLPWMIGWLHRSFLKEPHLQSVLKSWNRFSPREMAYVLMVHTGGHELKFIRIDSKTATHEDLITARLEKGVASVKQDSHYEMGLTYRLVQYCPPFLMRTLVAAYAFLAYDLKFPMPKLGLPQDPFGAVVITNVGSLGVDQAFVPLAPITRSAVMICMGKVRKVPMVFEDQVAARYALPLSFTVDHRYVDGTHCAMLVESLQSSLREIIREKINATPGPKSGP